MRYSALLAALLSSSFAGDLITLHLRGDGWICSDGSKPPWVKIGANQQDDHNMFDPSVQCDLNCRSKITMRNKGGNVLVLVKHDCTNADTKHYCFTFKMPDESGLDKQNEYECGVRKSTNPNIYAIEIPLEDKQC
ncbi:unnamed protein product, partial [Mesorhabditis spiculigera]